MTDDEIVQSARGMIVSWLGEWALMLRMDQTPDQLGLDAQNRVIDRHIDYLLSVRATLAELWDWPPPPAPFPFQERTDNAACPAETRSWDHFSPEQMDSYWIRCTLLGPHERHEDEHTGLTWTDRT